MDIFLTNKDVADSWYQALRGIKPNKIDGQGYVKINRPSGDFYLDADQVIRALTQLTKIDSLDGNNGQIGLLPRTQAGEIEYPIVSVAKAELSAQAQSNYDRIKTLSSSDRLFFKLDQKEVMRSGRTPSPPSSQDFLELAAIVATDDRWGSEVFSRTGRECSEPDLPCFYGLLCETAAALVTFGKKGKTVYLCLGYRISDQTDDATLPRQWQMLVRHERGHDLQQKIAQKWGASSYTDAMMKSPKGGILLKEILAAAKSEREQKIIKQYTREACDGIFYQIAASSEVKRGYANGLRRHLKDLLPDGVAPDKVRENVELKIPNREERLPKLTALIFLARAMSVKEAGQAEKTLKQLFPNDGPLIEKYFSLFRQSERFFQSEISYLKKINPNFFEKI